MINEKSEFSERMEEILLEKNLKAADISRLTGIEKSMLSKYLRKIVSPKLEIVVKIAEAININPLWLAGFEAPKQVSQDAKIKKINTICLNFDDAKLNEALKYIEYLNEKEA